MSTRTKILVGVAALAVLVLALSRGGEPSSELTALEADPMATWTPPGGALVDTDSQSGGTVLGEPVSASYTRLFTVPASSAARALDDAEAAAKDAGWQSTSRSAKRSFSAEKRDASGRLALDVVLVEDERLLPDGVAPPALSVNLRHLGA